MKTITSLVLAVLVLVCTAMSARADIAVRDTVTDNAWQGGFRPAPTHFGGGVLGAAGVSIVGNGQVLSRVGLVLTFNSGPNTTPPLPGELDFRVNHFGSATHFDGADWNGSGALPFSVGGPVNAGAFTSVATFGSFTFYYMEVNLLELALGTTLGANELLAISVRRNSGRGVPAVWGTMSGLGLDRGVNRDTFPYTGPIEPLINHFGDAGFSNVAARVYTVPTPPAVALLGIVGLRVCRRHRR